jgi:hypothetical protein
MSIASKILKGVAGGAAVALPIVRAFVPGPAGLLIDVIGGAIIKAEAELGKGNGKAKAERAASIVADAAPALVAAVEANTGKELADEELFAVSLGQLQQGVFGILKSFRLI